MKENIKIPEIRNARFIKLIKVYLLDRDQHLIESSTLLKHQQYRALYVDNNGKYFVINPTNVIDERDVFTKYNSLDEIKEKMRQYALERVKNKKLGYVLDPNATADEDEIQQ